MQTVADIGPRLGIAPTCQALGVARATYYRSRRPKAEPVVRTSPRALLARGQAKPFRTAVRGFDRHLLDLLDLLIAPDPRHRPASGLEVLRLMREPGWALPDRTPAVELLVSSLLVGREQARAELEAVLRRASSGGTHAVEVVGAPGMGRSRLLAEAGAKAASEGWAVVRVEAPADVDGLRELASAVRLALGSSAASEAVAGTEESGPSEASATLLTLRDNGSETPRFARLTEAICAAQDQASARLLLLADNADRLPADLVAGLRYLITEAGPRPLLVIASGERSVGLPDAAAVAIGPLAERDLRRLLAPLLTEMLNPEEVVAALRQASGGNPLWVRLLLAAWLESGRLRFTRGRPFFDAQRRFAMAAPAGARGPGTAPWLPPTVPRTPDPAASLSPSDGETTWLQRSGRQSRS